MNNFDFNDNISKQIFTVPIGPKVEELWRMKSSTDNRVSFFEEEIIIKSSTSLRCLNLYTSKEVWSYTNKYLSDYVFLKDKVLIEDFDGFHVYFPKTKESVQIDESFDSTLTNEGIHNNKLLADQVLNLETFEVDENLPEREWSGHLGDYLLYQTEDETKLFLYNLYDYSVSEYPLDGSSVECCNDEILIVRSSKGYKAFSFPAMELLWNYQNLNMEPEYLYTKKFIGFCQREGGERFILLDIKTGKEILTGSWSRCRIAGDRFIWVYEEEKFSCFDINSKSFVSSIPRGKFDYIEAIVMDCLLVYDENTSELVCYRSTN